MSDDDGRQHDPERRWRGMQTPGRPATLGAPAHASEQGPAAQPVPQQPVPRHHSRFADRLAERRIRHLQRGYVYRIGVATAGFGVLSAGVLMLVLPGPGLLVSAIGLGMLALEFSWAERLLLRVVARLDKAKDQTRRLLRRRSRV